MSRTAFTLWGLAAVALSGCEEFATPADLDRPQVIAIIAEPPIVEPGGTSALTIVVVGPDGPIDAPEVEWTVVTLPGRPRLGRIDADANGVRYVAPAEVDGQPTATALEARVRLPDRELVASKLVGIGALALFNPTVTGLAVDDAELAAGPTPIAAGTTVAIEARVEPAPSEDATYSWYSTAGTIERFRSNPTELVVDAEAGPAWLFAVVRDHGGQALRVAELVVE